MNEKNSNTGLWLNISEACAGAFVLNLDLVERFYIEIVVLNVSSNLHFCLASGDIVTFATTSNIALIYRDLLINFLKSRSSYIAMNLNGPSEITF